MVFLLTTTYNSSSIFKVDQQEPNRARVLLKKKTTPTTVTPSACVEESEGGYGSLNVESSLDSPCSDKNTPVKPSTAKLLLFNSQEQLRYLCVFVPLCHLLLCRRVWSLHWSSIDGLIKTVGFLLGTAGSVGLHITGQYCGDGRRRSRLCFVWRLSWRRRQKLAQFSQSPKCPFEE